MNELAKKNKRVPAKRQSEIGPEALVEVLGGCWNYLGARERTKQAGMALRAIETQTGATVRVFERQCVEGTLRIQGLLAALARTDNPTVQLALVDALHKQLDGERSVFEALGSGRLTLPGRGLLLED